MPPPKKTLSPEDSRRYFIYVAEATAGEFAYFKIGVSNELVGRLTSIDVGCPIPIQKLVYTEVDSKDLATALESVFHLALLPAWSSGEWFKGLCDHDLLTYLNKVAAEYETTLSWRKMEIRDRIAWKPTPATREANESRLRRVVAEEKERRERQRIEDDRIAKIEAHRPAPIISYWKRVKNPHLKGAR